MNTSLFDRYAAIMNSDDRLNARDSRFLMAEDGNVSVYYAPFEYIDSQARVVLVGITPGPTQMANALNEARRSLLSGKAAEESIKAAKCTAAFSGEPLRRNLIRQLDDWGFHEWLGLGGCNELFGPARHLVHTTSLLRYPVFVAGADYRGSPDMMRHPLLRKFLFEYFVSEIDVLKDALLVPLGPTVEKVLTRLASDGVLNPDRLACGLLHPSGNCTYRIKYLIGDRRGPVPHATNPIPYDRGRASFRARFLKK